MGLRDELEEASRLWDWWQRLVLRISMLAGIGVGGLFFVGPGDLKKELPWHREVGIGIALFSLVFLIALSGNGGIFARAKNLLLACCFGVFAAGLGFGAYVEISGDESNWKTWGFAALGVVLGLAALDRLWAMLTGGPALDEETESV